MGTLGKGRAHGLTTSAGKVDFLYRILNIIDSRQKAKG